MADLALRPGGTHLTRTIDDIGEMLAAATAAGFCGWRASKAVGRPRVSWLLIGTGCGAWAVGEAIWCYYELLQSRSTPFPSWADAGFLLFPVLALVGLLFRPSAAFAGQGRIRVALDATIIAAALFLVSWVLALGPVYQAGADSRFAAIVSLAYPVSDLMLLTVTVIVLSYSHTGDRLGLSSIAAGFLALCVGDSGFAYLTATDKYGAVNLIDAGWVAGFLIIALAALLDTGPRDDSPRLVAPRTALLLPYAPALAAIVTTMHELSNAGLDQVETAAASTLVGALIARQVLVLLDNRTLMSRISHQAFHDVLTGLANRALFNDRLEHALDLHRRDLREVTVLLLDLDDFKTVNDSLGHPAGDELLVRVSERLCATVRTGDTVARLGGDEFAILMEDGGDALDLAARLLSSLDLPVTLAERQITVRASIGLATVLPADPPVTGTEMLQRADVAMYAAKRAGKATVVTYTPSLDADAEQLDLHNALAVAVSLEEIGVAYQPIFGRDGALRGFEALARWDYRGRPVSPGVFLDVARRLGCLTRLDELVLGKAAAEASGWPTTLFLSVNVDGETLSAPDAVERLLDTIRRSGLDPRRIAVEVLESSLIEYDAPALSTLAALRQAGVRVVVDDFGAGYASLVRLQALHPHVVKIDRSLVAEQTSAHAPTALLAGVVQLAHRIGAAVIAEGIETQLQLSAATAAGCEYVQGFLLGRPGSPTRCRETIRRGSVEILQPSLPLRDQATGSA